MMNKTMTDILNMFYLAGFSAGASYVQAEVAPILEALNEELKEKHEADAFKAMEEHEYIKALEDYVFNNKTAGAFIVGVCND